MAILEVRGWVATDKVGSRAEFAFEIDEANLPTDPAARKEAIDAAARDALYESGVFEWSYTLKHQSAE